MQLEDKVFCHWDLVRFVSEKGISKEDGTLKTLSITEGKKLELMIYLGKDNDSSEYEVRVYKNDVNDKYVPHKSDKILRYEDSDEYATFFFDDFDKAKNFVEDLGYLHKEYRVRPIKEIKNAI